MRVLSLSTTAVSLALLCGGAAFAQSSPSASSPSADQILSALRPTAQSLHGATRGIRPVGSMAAAPVPMTTAGHVVRAAATGHARVSEPGQAAPSVNLQVDFRSGSADLTPAAVRSLDALGKALSDPQLAGYRFKIIGHTDTVGTPDANKALSEQRAKAVADYLASKFGVSQNRLDEAGMGEQDLLVPTGDQVNEPRNRRVQVINLGA